MNPKEQAESGKAAVELSAHMKWLVTILTTGWLLCQVWDRLAAGIERDVSERVSTSRTLAALTSDAARDRQAAASEDEWTRTKFTGQLADTKTWIDGRINTQSESIASLRRDLDTLSARVATLRSDIQPK